MLETTFHSFGRRVKWTNINKYVSSETIRGYNSIHVNSTNPQSIKSEKSHVADKKIIKLGSPGVSLDSKIFEILMATYPQIIEAVSYAGLDDLVHEELKKFQKLCYYTDPNRELYATPALLNAYTTLTEQKNLTFQNIRLACILAWCFELCTTAMLVVDDVLDNQDERWRTPSLHKIAGPAVSVNIRLFHVFGYTLITQYFKNHTSYIPLMNIFSDCINKSCTGQDYDGIVTTNFKNQRNLEWISFRKYLVGLKYKVSYVMFKSPTLAAIYLSNKGDDKVSSDLNTALDKLTLHFQTMNDMWDCYGKYNTYGRIGTDIREGKCTWLSATALECMNKRQLGLFQQHYGVDDQKCEEIIKNIYEEIKIPEKYRQQKFKIREELLAQKRQLPESSTQNFLQSLLETYVDINEDFTFN